MYPALTLKIPAAGYKTKPGFYSTQLQYWYDRGKHSIFREFAGYIAKIYKGHLVAAIDDQRFSKYWQPLSKKYLDYKKAMGYSLKTWEATGYLKKSISYWKVGAYAGIVYYVGVHPSVEYPNGVKVSLVVRALEYGTKDIPSRPLFRPIVEYMRPRMAMYTDMFLRKKKYK